MLAGLRGRKHNISLILLSFSLLCVLLFFVAKTLTSVQLANEFEVQNIAYLVRNEGQLDIESVQNLAPEQWQPIRQDSISMGLAKQVFWFSFTLPGAEQNDARLLQIDNSLIDVLDIWFVSSKGIIAKHQVGDTLPFSQRALTDKVFLFEIPDSLSEIQVYIRVQSTSALQLPIKLWENSQFIKFNSHNSLILGLFFGLMLAMGLSYFFFFITSKRTTFLVYSGYVSSLILTLASLSGLGYQYLWPELPWLQQHALGIFASLSLCLAMIFCQRLLHVKNYSERLSKLLTVGAYIILLGLVLSLILPFGIFIQSFILILCLAGSLVLAVAIWLALKGVKIAILYAGSWFVLLLTSLLVCLDSLSFIQLNMPNQYLLIFGASIETVVLALILAINHNQQRQSLIATQMTLLEQEQQAQTNQKQMLALQENANEELEYKVQERTLELEVALRELSEINRELEQKNTLDALTGIRNRHFFDKKYQAEVRRSRREQTKLSIAMIDIDHFKKVNDEYGHLVGDECIKTVANTLKNGLKRPSDDVCRYGGEEFALILPNTDLAGAMGLVEQLRIELQNTTIQAEHQSINVTISAGIACAITELNQPEDAILALADKQLYLAKESGRNNVKGSHLSAPINQEGLC